MSGRNSETNITKSILLAVGGVGGPGMAWQQTVGKFRSLQDPSRLVQVGVPGMSDVLAVVPVVITQEMVGKAVGVAVGIEVKTATGKQREAQKLWQLALERKGGIYLLSRSPEQALQQVARLPEIILSKS